MPSELVLSLVLFSLVGLIVSMDVSGLTLSKTEEFTIGRQSVLGWALSNALWHSGLLSIYLLVINGFLRISPDYLLWVERIFTEIVAYFPRLDRNLIAALRLTASAIREHISIFLGIVALLIVWRTYSDKIISKPEQADIADLPLLARSTFNVVDLIARAVTAGRVDQRKLRRFVNTQAQAALVAVDMLALAILLKSSQAIQSIEQGVFVVGIVFAIVLALTVWSANLGIEKYAELAANKKRRFDLKSLEWIRITLRLSEPFLIFYFVLQLVALLLLGKHVHGASLLFGAALLLTALIQRYTLAKIIEHCLAASAPSTLDEAPLRPIRTIGLDILRLALVVTAVIVLVTTLIIAFSLFLWARYDALPTKISFDSEISFIVGWAAILSTIAFFPKFKILDPIEDRIVDLLQIITKHRRTFAFMVGALFIATVFPVYDQLVDKATENGLGVTEMSLAELIQPNHRHALQVGVWLSFFFVLGVVLDVAEKRHQRSLARSSKKGDPQTYYWRWLYPSILTIGGVLLLIVGWLQARITT